MSKLFEKFKIREVEFRNRIVVSPMCQYSAVEGVPQTWHLVHLGSRAVGGAALVMTEATAVEAAGRISAGDTGIYNEAHVAAWKPITAFIKEQGAVPGVQLAHAGRKASVAVPWAGGKSVSPEQGGWTPIWAPSALPFDADSQTPKALTLNEISQLVQNFRDSAKRALSAGFQVIEVHAAHGYLLHEFLSPLSNLRDDQYGGSLENRMRLVVEVVKAIRAEWPAKFPLFVRISATDWTEGGWDDKQSVELARVLKNCDVDLIDCSSGGNVPKAKIPTGPGYQVPFAEKVKKEAGIATGAVGLITEAHQAEQILSTGQADMIFLARALLRDPYWPVQAAKALGVSLQSPVQYLRAWT